MIKLADLLSELQVTNSYKFPITINSEEDERKVEKHLIDRKIKWKTGELVQQDDLLHYIQNEFPAYLSLDSNNRLQFDYKLDELQITTKTLIPGKKYDVYSYVMNRWEEGTFVGEYDGIGGKRLHFTAEHGNKSVGKEKWVKNNWVRPHKEEVKELQVTKPTKIKMIKYGDPVNRYYQTQDPRLNDWNGFISNYNPTVMHFEGNTKIPIEFKRIGLERFIIDPSTVEIPLTYINIIDNKVDEIQVTNDFRFPILLKDPEKAKKIAEQLRKMGYKWENENISSFDIPFRYCSDNNPRFTNYVIWQKNDSKVLTWAQKEYSPLHEQLNQGIAKDKPRIKVVPGYVRQHYKLNAPGDFVKKVVDAIEKQNGLATLRQNQIVQNYLKGKKYNDVYSTKH